MSFSIRTAVIVQLAFGALLAACAAPQSSATVDPIDSDEQALDGEADWQQIGRTPRRTSWNSLESVIGIGNVASLQEQWSLADTYAPSIALWGGQLFVSNTRATGFEFFEPGRGISALSAETGAPIWAAPLAGDASGSFDGDEFTSDMAVAYGKIYIQHVNFSPLFSTKTGKLLPGRSSMGSGMDDEFSSPLLKGNTMILEKWASYYPALQDYRRTLQVIDTVTDQYVWTTPLGEGFERPHDPALASGTVFTVAESPNKLVAFDLATGQPRWASAAVTSALGSPSVISGRVFVVSKPNTLRAYSEKTGALLWQTAFTGGSANGPFEKAPVLDATSAYLTLTKAAGGIVVGAFAADTGARRWAVTLGAGVEIGSSGSILANGVLYVGAESGKLYALNAQTGAVLKTLVLSSAVYRMIVADGRLFVATLSSGVHAFGIPAPAAP